MQCLTKGRLIISLTQDSQIEATSHIVNMLGTAHKETTSPTIGLWHVFKLYLHLHMEHLLNHRDSRVRKRKKTSVGESQV